MSATTENLLEEIKNAEIALAICGAAGDAAGAANAATALKELRKRLAKANEALTEGRQLLKS